MLGKVQVLLAILLVAGFGLFSPLLAGEKPIVPETVAGVENVSAEQVQKSIAAGAKVYDVRPERAHVKGKLPGTELLWYNEKSPKVAEFDASVDEFDLSRLPQNKAAEVVFYCNGATCWKSYKASIVATKAGYTNVKWFRGGVPEWKEQGLAVVVP